MVQFLSFVRSLFQSPPGVDLRYQRYFVATNSIYVLAGLIHFAFIFFFWAVGAWEMACFNLGSVLWFGFTIWINRRKFLFTSLYLCFSEVFLHALAATYFFGWGAGYQYYMMLFATGIFLLPPGRTALKFGSIVLGCLLFASSYYYSMSFPPVYAWDEGFLALINVSNIIFSTLFHAGFAYYFTLSANVAEDSLERENKAQKAFFQNISHELRTPLTLISGPSESAVERGEGLSEPEVRVVANQARRLTRLVNQLLDLQKITSGSMELKKQNLPLGEFVSFVAENFKGYLSQKGIHFSLSISDVPMVVSADPEQLDKCLFNYLSNAIKFTPAGGTITLSLEKNQNMGIVSVSDTGIGMEDDQIRRLFSRFGISEASLTREQEGTGIGLSLVKELVELHGGRVGVDSVRGKGSHFYFQLPLVENPPEVHFDTWKSLSSTKHEYIADISSPNKFLLDTKVPSQKTKILIVEDNPDLRSYLASVLARFGFQVLVASDGQAGIDAVFSESPNLVITDLMMPKRSGLDLIREVRKKDYLKSLPIILLTAKADENTRLELREEGADSYLAKPFLESELLSMIRNSLRLREKEEYYKEEMARGIRIQKKLLPNLEWDPGLLSVQSVFLPSDGIAGDYYAVLSLGNGKTFLFLADVSGHGFSAGMIAAMLHFVVLHPNTPKQDPKACLEILNQNLFGNTAGLFITAVAVVIDSNLGKIFWSKAGHEDIYLQKPSSGVRKILGKGKPLALFSSWEGETQEEKYEIGDTLYLCSDGLMDARRNDGEMFREKGFNQWFLSQVGNKSVSLDDLVREATIFQGKDSFEDDVTLLKVQMLA